MNSGPRFIIRKRKKIDKGTPLGYNHLKPWLRCGFHQYRFGSGNRCSVKGKTAEESACLPNSSFWYRAEDVWYCRSLERSADQGFACIAALRFSQGLLFSTNEGSL